MKLLLGNGNPVRGWLLLRRIRCLAFFYVPLDLGQSKDQGNIVFFGIPPMQDASQHQDHYSFSRESLKTFICHCYWEGGSSNNFQYILYIHHIVMPCFCFDDTKELRCWPMKFFIWGARGQKPGVGMKKGQTWRRFHTPVFFRKMSEDASQIKTSQTVESANFFFFRKKMWLVGWFQSTFLRNTTYNCLLYIVCEGMMFFF